MQPQDTTTTPVPTTKRCTKCGETKPLGEFTPDNRKKDGRQAQCKTCRSSVSRTYRADNPDKIAELNHSYHLANRDRLREESRKRYADDAKKRGTDKRLYALSNAKKLRAQEKVHYAVRKGELLPPSECLCWVCGIGRWEDPDVVIEYHHVDYDKPLDVFPVCGSHHRKWHLAMQKEE